MGQLPVPWQIIPLSSNHITENFPQLSSIQHSSVSRV